MKEMTWKYCFSYLPIIPRQSLQADLPFSVRTLSLHCTGFLFLDLYDKQVSHSNTNDILTNLNIFTIFSSILYFEKNSGTEIFLQAQLLRSSRISAVSAEESVHLERRWPVKLSIKQHSRAVGSKGGGAEGTSASPPPVFGQTVNPISTRGAYYAHPSTTSSPGFSDLATALHRFVGQQLRKVLLFWLSSQLFTFEEKREEKQTMEVFKNSVKKSKQSDSEMPPEMPLMPGFARNSILSASFRSVRSSSLSAITKYGSVIESSSFKSLNSRFLLEFYKIV